MYWYNPKTRTGALQHEGSSITNWVGALAGMISGAVTVIVWRQLDPFGWGLYEIVPGFIVAFISIMLFNMLGTSRSEQMQSDFNAVNEDPESRY
jgi:Na+/proline symporter